MSKTEKPNRGGRPPVDTEPVTVRLPREMINDIETFRREQAVIPTRPEAIRIILSNWIDRDVSARELLTRIDRTMDLSSRGKDIRDTVHNWLREKGHLSE